jgi:hypothetical protein
MGMDEIPSARVENARPPIYRRAGFRRTIGVAIVVLACLGGWRLLKRLYRTDANMQLEARQDKARAAVGDGFDELFDRELDADTSTVLLEGDLDVASPLDRESYKLDSCAKGFDDAFKEALGPDVVSFSTSSYGKKADRLRIAATITPHGAGFQLPNSPTVYRGIALGADLHFLDKDLHVDATPAEEIEFEHVVIGYDLSGRGPETWEVNGGILQGACKQAALSLIESMTTWQRATPPKRDPVKECERGFHCRENAEQLEATDKLAAMNLYLHACEHDDEEACTRAAELGVVTATHGTDDPAIRARVGLELTCSVRDLASACAGAARLSLVPFENGKPPSDYQRSEALPLYLRACDLGGQAACEAAAPLLAKTPFADAAPLLAGKRTITSKTFGTAFAIKWGQWYQMDRGQPTLWISKRPAKLPEEFAVAELTLDRVPPGIVAPAGLDRVFAVFRQSGRAEDRCQRCNPSGHGDGAFAFRSMDCVCAIAPKR